MPDQTKEHVSVSQPEQAVLHPEQTRPAEHRIENESGPEHRIKRDATRTSEASDWDKAEKPRRIAQPMTKTASQETALSFGTDLAKVEAVLEENMQEIFQSMTPAQQQQFKIVGEETARTVATLLNQVKVKVSAIAQAILRWLRFIPGVSQYYMEQEAKIKTEKLLRLRSERIQ